MTDTTEPLTDFDAAEPAEGPTIRVCGRDWQLPADCPYEVIASLDRMQQLVAFAQLKQAGRDGEVPPELLELLELLTGENGGAITDEGVLRRLVGDDLVDAWLEAGASWRQIRAIKNAAWQFYETGDWPTGHTLGGPATSIAEKRAEQAEPKPPRKPKRG